jgi:hypothetical protein
LFWPAAVLTCGEHFKHRVALQHFEAKQGEQSSSNEGHVLWADGAGIQSIWACELLEDIQDLCRSFAAAVLLLC